MMEYEVGTGESCYHGSGDRDGSLQTCRMRRRPWASVIGFCQRHHSCCQHWEDLRPGRCNALWTIRGGVPLMSASMSRVDPWRSSVLIGGGEFLLVQS